MSKRRLNLRREALAELTTREIERIPAAASGLGCLSIAQCPTTGGTITPVNCTNGPCASDFQECNTHNCG